MFQIIPHGVTCDLVLGVANLSQTLSVHLQWLASLGS